MEHRTGCLRLTCATIVVYTSLAMTSICHNTTKSIWSRLNSKIVLGLRNPTRLFLSIFQDLKRVHKSDSSHSKVVISYILRQLQHSSIRFNQNLKSSVITAGGRVNAKYHPKNAKNGQKSVKGSKFRILSIIFGTKSGYYVPILHTFLGLQGVFGCKKMGWVVVLGQISSVLTRFSIDYIFETIQDTDLKIYIQTNSRALNLKIEVPKSQNDAKFSKTPHKTLKINDSYHGNYKR